MDEQLFKDWNGVIFFRAVILYFVSMNECIKKIMFIISIIILVLNGVFFLSDYFKNYLYELTVNNLLFMEEQLEKDIQTIQENLDY